MRAGLQRWLCVASLACCLSGLTQSDDGVVRNDLAFLRVVILSTNVYRGEMFAVDMQIHFPGHYGRRIDINELRNHPPRARTEGIRFLLNRSIFQPTHQQVAGQVYPIFHYRDAGVATRAGKLELLFNTELVLDDFTEVIPRQIKLRLASPIVPLTVKPLPTQGQPADFSGAVGDFQLIVQTDRTRVEVNNPVELTAILRGAGPLDIVPAPAPANGWEGFRVDALSPRLDTSVLDLANMMVFSTKTFPIRLLPRRPGRQIIPPVRFSWFDPKQQAYRTVTSHPTPLEVFGDVPTETPAPVEGNVEITPPAAKTGADEAPPALRPQLGALAPSLTPLLRQPWFFAAQAVPLLAMLTALAWRKRQDYLAAHPRLVRRRRVARTVRRGLRQLRGLQQPEDAPAFYDLAFRLLQEQIGERLDCPADGLTEAIVPAALTQRLPAATAESLQSFFAAWNQVRFGAGSTAQSLAQARAQLEQLLLALQELEAPRDAA